MSPGPAVAQPRLSLSRWGLLVPEPHHAQDHFHGEARVRIAELMISTLTSGGGARSCDSVHSANGPGREALRNVMIFISHSHRRCGQEDAGRPRARTHSLTKNEQMVWLRC